MRHIFFTAKGISSRAEKMSDEKIPLLAAPKSTIRIEEVEVDDVYILALRPPIVICRVEDG